MRILIVGGTSSLTKALLPVLLRFAEVLTAGREKCDVYLSLSDPIEKMEIPRDIDVVINTAALSGTQGFNGMFETVNINVLGVLKLCEACKQARVKHIVHVSSIFALLEPSSPYYNAYSLSKKQSEELAALYCNTNEMPLTIIRPSQFYGVGECYRKNQPFLFSIMDKAELDENIFIYGTNDAVRNFIHIEDVANIIALIIQQEVFGIYNCLSNENVSYSEVTKAAIEAFESKSILKFLRDKPDIPDNGFNRDDRLFTKLEYTPQISIKDGMKKEATYRKNRR